MAGVLRSYLFDTHYAASLVSNKYDRSESVTARTRSNSAGGSSAAARVTCGCDFGTDDNSQFFFYTC